MGDRRGVKEAMGRGYALLQQMPRPANPRNHFVIDVDKYDFYAMELEHGLGVRVGRDRSAMSS